MLENEQVLVTGRTFYEAFTALTVLEKAAELMLKADVLGGGIPVPPVRAALEHRIYTMKYSKAEESHKQRETTAEEKPAPVKPADMSDDEWEKRCQLVEYGKKLLTSGLVQGTWGNLSVRLDETHMIVTPSGLDYNRLTPLDEVKVEIETGEYEGDLKPTSETAIHCGIYALRPDVGAIMHTHSKYCAVFAAAHMPLEIEDPALAEVFGSDMLPCAEYGLSGTKTLARNILKVMTGAAGCLMRNHGMIAVGTDIEHAFDRCLKMEQAAKAGVERRWAKMLEDGDDGAQE
jgi:L-fuculose-phosphate aldolase